MYQIELLPNKKVKVVNYKPFPKETDKENGKESVAESHDSDSQKD